MEHKFGIAVGAALSADGTPGGVALRLERLRFTVKTRRDRGSHHKNERTIIHIRHRAISLNDHFRTMSPAQAGIRVCSLE
ncbi:MAG: hypothetical protein ACJARL_002590 [Halopseudomonas sp.]|jgi:hypothetical protein